MAPETTITYKLNIANDFSIEMGYRTLQKGCPPHCNLQSDFPVYLQYSRLSTDMVWYLQLYDELSPRPIAAASLGQVCPNSHYNILHCISSFSLASSWRQTATKIGSYDPPAELQTCRPMYCALCMDKQLYHKQRLARRLYWREVIKMLCRQQIYPVRI